MRCRSTCTAAALFALAFSASTATVTELDQVNFFRTAFDADLA